jgi:hypothetical protein
MDVVAQFLHVLIMVLRQQQLPYLRLAHLINPQLGSAMQTVVLM